MAGSECVCWCASDVKCPHGIAERLPLLWEEMENSIDKVLLQFDRKTVRNYLKRETIGFQKPTSKFKDVSQESA